jgi:hypothetical protein
MATTVINRYRPVVQPRLPAAPTEYDAQFIEQYSNILRLYFNQLDNLTGVLLGESGGRYIRFPYGAFSSDQSQTTTSNTETVMTLNTTDFSNDVSMGTVAVPSTSKITVVNAGIYNLQFSAQFQNKDNAIQDISIWLKQNGVNIPGSTGLVSIPARKSASAGEEAHEIVGWNYYVSMTAGQYIEIYWSTTLGGASGVTIQNYAASTGPIRPSTQSVVATLSFVSALAT